MMRRLLLTCGVLLCQTLAQTMVYIILIALVTLVVEQQSSPYANPFLR